MREMKDIVESVSIGIEDVVRKRIADKNPVHAEVAATTGALIDGNRKLTRELLFRLEVLVKVRKIGIVRRLKAANGLGQVHSHDFRKRNPCRIECLQVAIGKTDQSASWIGYEVEACPLSLWEIAILKGYEVFRQVKRNLGGTIICDRNARTVEYKTLEETAHEA